MLEHGDIVVIGDEEDTHQEDWNNEDEVTMTLPKKESARNHSTNG